ncbi:lymphoid-specific helicase isoform X3 [Amia ocellicauda]|uniref:lymphoid-specific helicase isoform X3 n=1 Tax=Amia ocellicauda TaxID=2972642 RepID=UPI0034642435
MSSTEDAMRSDSPQCPKPNEPEEPQGTAVEQAGPGRESPTENMAGALGAESIITQEMLDEEKKLMAEGEKEEKEMLEKARASWERESNEMRYKRLQHLLEKSNVYSKFLLTKMEQQQLEEKKRKEKLEKKRAALLSKEKGSENKTASETVERRKRGREEEYKIADIMSKEDILSKAKRPKVEVKDEPMSPSKKWEAEDIEKMSDSNSDIKSRLSQTERENVQHMFDPLRTVNGKPVPYQQPKYFTGGIMRWYQVEGMEWLSMLWENGINGILADEMGLGKTIQCIATISMMVERGVPGPYLVVGPLSTLPNWVAEFKRFTPEISVLLYHGPQKERHELVKKIRKRHGSIQMHPVVITSFDIAMRDRKFLQNCHWKYLIVDEGHRIKNMKCRLVQELKLFHSENKLLLTGTPLQNNLSELWSLLNFLLPDVFDDLKSFESWFDLSSISSDAENIVHKEREQNILHMLHQVFIRIVISQRLKFGFLHFVFIAILQLVSSQFRKSVKINRVYFMAFLVGFQILTPFLLRRLKTDVTLEVPPKREVIVYAPLTSKQEFLYTAIVNKTIRQVLGQKEVNTAPVQLTPSGRPKRRSRRAVNYSELVDRSDDLEKLAQQLKKEEAEQLQIPVSDVQMPADVEIHVQMNSALMILRRCCNHPYLIEYPLDPVTQGFKIDEQLVESSGKFLVLDRMLPELKKRGHKVLIFSQMTSILDIIMDYCYLRDYKYSRLDGSMSYTEREDNMNKFISNPEVFLFLLSTRAGGLGINLTSADTVIIFDSDWNPQADLQAQDRCHRIGQTKPVVVYRLVTANTIDQKIVERASAKRKLEKMVIHKNKFKGGKAGLNQSKSCLDPQELMDLLKSRDFEREVKGTGRKVISDRDLKALLDRSDLLALMKSNMKQEEEGVFKVIENDEQDSAEIRLT